ncbi:unnamed protein product [Mytilus coruscus]|uniref:Farnesoic acid O-methyl transferase domain-containing protein n=1 Tax=Mytilus coruscus TaxID=42192 RepID=A0A6J8BRK6_MYTCO|nr:unnamed protein product [Mytilus coruscus]
MLVISVLVPLLSFVSGDLDKIKIHTDDAGKINAHSSDVLDHVLFLNNSGRFKGSLVFEFKGCSGARIYLTERSDKDQNQAFYEILLYAGTNKDVYLRRRDNGNTEKISQFSVEDLLNCTNFRPLWISWHNGHVKFGKGDSIHTGEYYHWLDQNPFTVQSIGIMTGYGTSGDWIISLPEPLCLCSCEYKQKLEYWSTLNATNHTLEELREILKPVLLELQRNLTVDKKMLSSYVRKHNSAKDKRPSSENIGIVGVIFISIVVGLVIFIDIVAIRNHLRSST